MASRSSEYSTIINCDNIDNIDNINVINDDDYDKYIPTFSIYSRFAFINRVCDGSPDFRTLSFNDVDEYWEEYNFFKQLHFLGLLTVSYNNSPYIIYNPTTKDDNRHQVLALSCYIALSYYNTNTNTNTNTNINNNNNNNNTRSIYITSPREKNIKSEFKALFKTNIKDVEIQYTADNKDKQIITIFKFDKTKESQFKLFVPLSKTDYV